MKATAWTNDEGSYGIRVGKANREQFFDKKWTRIDLDIDGQRHQIRLTAGFWNHCPEFRDPVIRNWLRENRTLAWPKGHPPQVELIPLGGNRFRLG